MALLRPSEPISGSRSVSVEMHTVMNTSRKHEALRAALRSLAAARGNWALAMLLHPYKNVSSVPPAQVQTYIDAAEYAARNKQYRVRVG